MQLQDLSGNEDTRSTPWKARHGCLCLTLLVFLTLLLGISIRFATVTKPELASWFQSPFGANARKSLQAVIWLLCGFGFTWSLSGRRALAHLGLRDRPSVFGWLTAWATIALACVGFYLVKQGWSVPNRRVYEAYASTRGVWLFYVTYVVLVTPFYEEMVLRGFVYRALRANIGILFSTAIVLCATTFFHWGLISQPRGSLGTFLVLCLGSTILCLTREKTDSLWNCVLIHAVYNSTVTLPWFVSVIALVLLLPLSVRRSLSTE